MRQGIRLTDLWIDNAPGERRAALVVAGEILEIHIQRDMQLILGQAGLGRIERKSPAGSYVITEDGTEILIRGTIDKADGAQIGYEIIRESISEPGRVKPAEARVTALCEEAVDTESLWNARLGALNAKPPISVPFGDAFDIAVAGSSKVGDATVYFQRTKAGVVFDVDGIGDAFAINSIAAQEIARLLRLYQIGGMVIIDFVAVDSKNKRQEIADIFDVASQNDGRAFERSAVNGFGVMQVVRGRPRPSVLDIIFGTRISSLSSETQALWLYRNAVASTGFGPRIVTTNSDVANILRSPKWNALHTQCERLIGASMTIIVDENITGYGHVHVAQS